MDYQHGYVAGANTAAAQITNLTRQLAEVTAERNALKADAERLDWVDANGYALRSKRNGHLNLLIWMPYELRNKIDAAREGE